MSAPDEAAALAVVRKVQSLGGSELEKRVRTEVGDPMLALFSLLAKSIGPPNDDQEVARKVHAMILAYLIRGELDSSATT